MATTNYSLTLPESGKAILAKDLKENFEKIDAAYDNYLPLTAGSSKLLTDNLFISKGMDWSSYNIIREIDGNEYNTSLGTGGNGTAALELWNHTKGSILNRIDLKSDGLYLTSGKFCINNKEIINCTTYGPGEKWFGNGSSTDNVTVLAGNNLFLYAHSGITIDPYYSKPSSYKFKMGSIDSKYTNMYFAPDGDGRNYLGYSTGRFHTIYAVNGVKTSSDIRVKKNISKDYTKIINALNELEPIMYQYADINDGKLRFGFIAQEVEEAFRNAGLDIDELACLQKDVIDPESNTAKFIGDTTLYSLNYSEFIAPIMAKVKEQDKEINTLKDRIDKQNDEITSMSKKLKELEEKFKELEGKTEV